MYLSDYPSRVSTLCQSSQAFTFPTKCGKNTANVEVSESWRFHKLQLENSEGETRYANVTVFCQSALAVLAQNR